MADDIEAVLESVPVQQMSKTEAKQLDREIDKEVAQINEDCWATALKIKRMKDERGWDALKFKSFRDWVASKDLSRQHAYRLIDYVDTTKAIGVTPGLHDIGEKQLRPLKALTDPAAKKAAWEAAVVQAKEQGRDIPSAAEVEASVYEIVVPPTVQEEKEPEPEWATVRDAMEEAKRLIARGVKLVLDCVGQPGGQLVNQSNIRQAGNVLNASIKATAPHEECPECRGIGCDEWCKRRGWVTRAEKKEWEGASSEE